jgi:ATP synthase I chain
MRINDENLIETVIKKGILLLALISAISYFLLPQPVTLGFFAGGLISLVNFIWQRRTIGQILNLGIKSPVLYATLRYITRLAAVGISAFLLIISGKVSIIALIAGLSLVVLLIIILTFYIAIQNKGE